MNSVSIHQKIFEFVSQALPSKASDLRTNGFQVLQDISERSHRAWYLLVIVIYLAEYLTSDSKILDPVIHFRMCIINYTYKILEYVQNIVD